MHAGYCVVVCVRDVLSNFSLSGEESSEEIRRVKED